ncbi:MAG: hypothetical protein WCD76_05630, partial [Pyrinomonadaceae bacterium]
MSNEKKDKRGGSDDLSRSDGPPPRADAPTPFDDALRRALARRELSLNEFCQTDDAVARRMLAEYGAMFVADACVEPPRACVFASESEVAAFQHQATWRSETLAGVQIELQPAAMDALLRARADALAVGLD